MPKSRQFRHACAVCGRVFTAHMVVVAHPRSAYALWLEEF